jgi:predicted secreted protein
VSRSDQQPPPDQLSIGVGEERTFDLAGAGSAGYEWELVLSGDDRAVVASVRSSPPPLVQPGATPVGRSARKHLVLEGSRPGTATVELRLRRSFAPASSPLASHRIVVTVV